MKGGREEGREGRKEKIKLLFSNIKDLDKYNTVVLIDFYVKIRYFKNQNRYTSSNVKDVP